jgi:Zn-dependent protease with chaperone function
MPFLLLLLLSLTCLQQKWPAPPEGLSAPRGAVVTWAGTGILVALTGLLTTLLRRRTFANPDGRSRVVRRFRQLRRFALFAHIGWFLVALYVLGWGQTVKGEWMTHDGATLPGGELVLLAPFLTGLILSWALYHDVDVALRSTSLIADQPPLPARWTQVLLQARHNLLLLVPPLLLMLVQQTVIWCFPALQNDDRLLPLFAVALLLALFVAIPWLLRILLGLKPLPAGELRDRLLATARRLRFRCNDILLWDTHNTTANAMVTGPLPFLRYVVLTDRLISEMTPEEVEAVFGHEVGHIKHHHLLFYFGFLIGSLAVLAGAWHGLGELFKREALQRLAEEHVPGVLAWAQANEMLTLLPLMGLLGGYIFVVFGFVSRRCERQADIFGCRTVSCAVFIAALEKVAWLNGISRDRPGWLSSWQHSTIARRVEFLERMSADPALEPRFQRRVRLIKLALLLGLAAAIVALVVWVPDGAWAFLRQG